MFYSTYPTYILALSLDLNYKVNKEPKYEFCYMRHHKTDLTKIRSTPCPPLQITHRYVYTLTHRLCGTLTPHWGSDGPLTDRCRHLKPKRLSAGWGTGRHKLDAFGRWNYCRFASRLDVRFDDSKSKGNLIGGGVLEVWPAVDNEEASLTRQ